MRIKRFLAFLLDLLIVGFLFIILYKILPVTENVKELNHSIAILGEKLLSSNISLSNYIAGFARLTYQIDKINVLHTGINVLLVIFYFVIVPIITKGYTLGLYLFKLKIEKKDGKITILDLLKRNVITTGIVYMIMNVFFVSFLSYKIYFFAIIILGIIQFSLVILSTFMIIYRKDQKGLQDLFSKTYIAR